MKKIIFETIGNILMSILFAAALIETFSINANYTSVGQEFILGKLSISFLIYFVLFGLSRWILSRKSKDYSSKKGEFSTADEREINNSYFASIISYKAIITSLIISLCLFVLIEVMTKPPFNSSFDLFISGIILITIVICIGFISYGIAWIFKDTR